jgi:cell fate (sporulation/competence/biofilm development) regulator YlbF (YheA/YmcA/DUF963 family)
MKHSIRIVKEKIQDKAMVVSFYFLELRLNDWLSDLITIILVSIKKFVG